MIDTAETVAFFVLPLLVLLGVAALFAENIPWLRSLTGAAPLQPEEPADTAGQPDFYVLGRGALTLSSVHADGAANAAATVRAVAAGRQLELPPAPAANNSSDTEAGGETR